MAGGLIVGSASGLLFAHRELASPQEANGCEDGEVVTVRGAPGRYRVVKGPPVGVMVDVALELVE